MFLAVLVQAQVRVFPVNDVDKDKAFAAYVKKLKDVVGKRDTAGLRRLSDESVIVASEPERKGWLAFLERWRPNDADSPLWPALQDLIDLGFVREHTQIFVAPYLAWRFPEDLDPERHVVAVFDDVAVRELPDARSPEVTRVKFEVLKLIEEAGRWVKVEDAQGRQGWADAAAVKKPTMARGQFSFGKKGWRMVSLER